jgi:hypothetical protein
MNSKFITVVALVAAFAMPAVAGPRVGAVSPGLAHSTHSTHGAAAHESHGAMVQGSKGAMATKTHGASLSHGGAAIKTN